MPGTFSKSARPQRPGAYFNFVAAQQEQILPSTASIVCVPFTSDWGPMEVPTTCTSFADFLAQFGPTTTTPGYIAINQAFKGEGLPGRGGAGTVVAYRMGGSSARASSKALQNTTPASALTLTAVYQGSYGNNLSVTTQVYAADNTRNELLLFVNGVQVEDYVYAPTDINGLRDQINASSSWVTAVANVNGVALSAVTSQAFTGGDDGSTLVSGDWTSMLSAVETTRFAYFAPFNLTDGSILTSVATWAENLNTKGKRFRTVVGGALDENVTTANTRSATLNDSNFVNLGVGGVVDDTFGVLSTAQLAPRLAGILAQCGEERSATFARLAGVSARNFATESDISKAFAAGTVVLSQDNNPNARVRIEKSLTTYTGGDGTKPYLIYRNPKYIATMGAIETELTEWAEQFVVGQLQVSDSTRSFVIGEAKARIQARVDRGILQPGPTVTIDPDPPPTPEDEFVALLYGIAFGRSVEQVFNTVNIG